MAENIVVSLFEVESEAYQAMTQMKQYPGDDRSYVAAGILVKKENDAICTLDSFDTGANTADDMAKGGLIGALFGILGGPVGVLLGGSYGVMLGSLMDTDDAIMEASLLEQITQKLENGEVALIALAYEEDEAILDQKLSGFKTIIARFDAADVAAEVEEARQVEKEMARLARKELRDEKKESRKQKKEELRAKMSAEWESFKAKFAKKDEDSAE